MIRDYTLFRFLNKKKINDYEELCHLIASIPFTKEQRIDYSNPMKAIKDKCMECCNNNNVLVSNCNCYSCPLYCYRFGKNPFKFIQKDETEEI